MFTFNKQDLPPRVLREFDPADVDAFTKALKLGQIP
jgi:hypothetical protein